MSRIGKLPINVPEKVKVNLSGNKLTIEGPKGKLEREFSKKIDINIKDNVINVARRSERKEEIALHGLTRALINNMVTGVSTGFQKILEISGVGYRASMKGKNLELLLGFSHPVLFEAQEGITFAVENNTKVIVSGPDKQQVGQIASDIRQYRPPEPYKGKGIKYQGEIIRRKAGKTNA